MTFDEMVEEVEGYVDDIMSMSLDDDWPDNEEKCLAYIGQELDLPDDSELPQQIFNKIMGL